MGSSSSGVFELSLEQREELLLSNRIVAWYDSVSIARAAEDRLTDWTFTDSNGGRWGVADGKIYLGDVALPLPLSFGTPVGPGNVQARRVWEFEEIERQSQRYLIEQTWKERAEAIRARRDRERAAARATRVVFDGEGRQVLYQSAQVQGDEKHSARSGG